MAHFFGTIQGSRGGASRLGSKASGLTVTAQSWEGSVTVTLHRNHSGECDYVTIQAAEGSTAGGRTIFAGRVRDLLDKAPALFAVSNPPEPEAEAPVAG